MNNPIYLLHFSTIIIGIQGIFPQIINLPADVIIWWRCIFAFFGFSIVLYILKLYDWKLIKKMFLMIICSFILSIVQ